MKPPRERLGFLTPAGLVAAVVTLALVGATAGLLGLGLFSAGPLSQTGRGGPLGGVASHAQLDNRCPACHPAPWESQTVAERCLACHADVATQIASKSALHGRLLARLSAPTCLGCHPEHRGRTASLTTTDPKTFPHDLTGYSLSGHQLSADGGRVTCAQCHPQGIASFDAAACHDCHAQRDATFMADHDRRFGHACTGCHNGAAGGSDFDHNRLPFKLVGRHQGLSCDRCHTDTSSVAALRRTPAACNACHAKNDAHQGKFGPDCGQCHTAAGWGNASFDHSVFPLDHGSRGTTTACATCHPNGTKTYTCFGCHAHDPVRTVGEHEGKSLSQIADCIRCHRGGGRGEGGG